MVGTSKKLHQKKLAHYATVKLEEQTRQTKLRNIVIPTCMGTVARLTCRWASVNNSTRTRTPLASMSSFTFF